MTLLAVEKDVLTLHADDPVLLSNANKSFFINDLGFQFDDTTHEFHYSGGITSDLVETVVEFLKLCAISYTLDDACSRLVEQNISDRSEFLKLQQTGNSIKDRRQYKSQEIPFMDRKKKLKPYQILPVLHASALGYAANFSVPGSGKTWMAYASYFIMKSRREVDKLLVIGPLSSFRPWETEYSEMTGNKPNLIRISGSPNKRKDIFSASYQNEIFLVSYNTAQNEEPAIKQLLQDHNFLLIVDESHHIKSPEGGRVNAILRLAQYAKRRMILSGTPIPNKIDDLWSQFTFLFPHGDVLGDYLTFKYDAGKEDALPDLSRKLYPFYTRISKKTLNLPKPNFVRLKVDMSPIQRRIYDAIKGFVRQNDPIYKNDAIAMQQFRRNSIIYLLEASTDPALLTKNTQYQDTTIDNEGLPIQELLEQYQKFETPRKLEAVKNLVEKDLFKSKKIIVWCSFVPSIKKLAEMLKKWDPITIWGAIPRDDEEDPDFNREAEIEKFKSESKLNLLIANPASLAESISLHKVCHHALYLDRTFNGGHYMQSLERIHRIGIDPKVDTKYTILLSKHSIDEIIDERLDEKKARMLKFLNEEDFGQLNLDLDYENAFGADVDFAEDYRRVLDHVMKD